MFKTLIILLKTKINFLLILEMSDIPSSANSNCPGINNENAGKASACSGCPNQKNCSTGVKPVDPDIDLIKDRLKNIKHKVIKYLKFFNCFI